MARVEFGISEDEFWELTLREFVTLADRYRERERRADYRAGIIASLIFNAHRTESADPMEPGDFFGWGRKKDEEGDIATLIEGIAAMNARLGGKDLRSQKKEEHGDQAG